MLLFVIIILCSVSSFSQSFYHGYAPLNVQGYVTHSGTKLASEVELELKKFDNPQFEQNLKNIQEKYPNTKISYSDISMPINAIEEQANNGNNKQLRRIITIAPKPVEITTSAMETLCTDMGFNKKTQRSTLEFYSCVTTAMKTKFTEETNKNIQYNTIDVNVVKALKSRTSVDSFIDNLIQHQELLSRRNKMDCLHEHDYHKCTTIITEYKLCHNKAVDTARIEHNTNKVICYIKTGIHFPNPKPQEAVARDAYYNVCVHLIEKDLRKTLFENNGMCNDILTKNHLEHLAV